MLLKEAIAAKVPFISVRTNDPLNLKAYLEDVSGQKPYEYKNGGKVFADRLYFFHHEKLQLTATKDLYKELVTQESVIIVINPNEPHPSIFDAGMLPVSRNVIKELLKEHMSSKDAEKLMPTVGGLTIKEVTDVLMITQARDRALTPKGMMKTRKQYLPKTQGLEMVDTTMPSYLPDKRLAEFAENQKPFFLNNMDMRLMPRGMIAHGMAGTGKSAGAKYLAETWNVPLYRLDSTVQSKWQGESEQNLTAALHHLEQEAPCILLLDEVEKLFNTNTGDNGTVQKMLGGLLWWLQEHQSRVFTVMTCNNIKIIPPELYRSGRIDEKFEFKGLQEKAALELAKHILGTYDINFDVMPSIKKHLKEFFKNTSRIAQADVNELVKRKIKEVYLSKNK